MTINDFLPSFIAWLNLATVLIITFNLAWCFFKIGKSNHKSVYLLNICFLITLELINIPASIRQYVFYFVQKSQLQDSLTLALFMDRYAMFFLSIISFLRIQKWFVLLTAEHFKDE